MKDFIHWDDAMLLVREAYREAYLVAHARGVLRLDAREQKDWYESDILREAFKQRSSD